MAVKVDRAKVCTECLTEPRRVRKGASFPLCDLCRPIVIGRKWKTRQMKRQLAEGCLISFNHGDGWRAGYLLKFRETRADVQPIGPVGRVPDIIAVNIYDLKREGASKLWENVQDFYRANRRNTVLVATDLTVPRTPTACELRHGQPPASVQKVTVAPKPSAPKAEKKLRGSAIRVCSVYGPWTVKVLKGHSRFECVSNNGEMKILYAAELRAFNENHDEGG